MNNVNPNQNDIVELTEQLRVLSHRFVAAQQDAAMWKLEHDIIIHPNAEYVEIKVFKPGNVAGGIKSLNFDTILDYAGDESTLASEIADQFIELLIKPQVKNALEIALTSVISNVQKIKKAQ